jgi:hypothetical protein
MGTNTCSRRRSSEFGHFVRRDTGHVGGAGSRVESVEACGPVSMERQFRIAYSLENNPTPWKIGDKTKDTACGCRVSLFR